MGIEIERKFLVVDERWRAAVTRSERMAQAYLQRGGPGQCCSVRVRLAGTQATLNIKSAEKGISRQEFEYPLPLDDAEALLQLAGGPSIDKIRHELPWQGLKFEIDEFLGRNAGLVVAEIELPAADTVFEHPPWLGQEVTEDLRYYNSELAARPYDSWSTKP